MRYIFFITLSFFLFTSPLFSKSELTETVILPVSSKGNLSESIKIIFHKSLSDELGKHFQIIPNEKSDYVLENNFNQQELNECAEESCMQNVQRLLNVGNVFKLHIKVNGNDTQLKLTWRKSNNQLNEIDQCLGCEFYQLNRNVRELANTLIAGQMLEVIAEVKSRQKGVLFLRKEFGKWGWYEEGNEEKHEKFQGEIRDGKPNGIGTLRAPNGGRYVGEFKDGIPDGLGILSLPDGKKYDGEWIEGIKEGKGICTFADGSIYKGELKNGLSDGIGTMNFPNGDKYVGEWKNGKKDGQGTYTFVDGRIISGEFKKDKHWNITKYDTEGKIVGSLMKGEEVVGKKDKGSLIFRLWSGGMGWLKED
ncbi:MAG: hypothetical protein MAG581_00302 [Deltaproteobacteria bacterium]|nr:hypothetical protein [Deltaproteobacteria bacterium]